jgi:hypothetical protein
MIITRKPPGEVLHRSVGVNGSERSPMVLNKPRPMREMLVAETEIFDLQTGKKLMARTSDMSLGGCYLETEEPMPVSTSVQLRMIYNETSLTVSGDVVRSEPEKGMAVRFRGLQADQTATLKSWLFSLSRMW